MLIEGDLIMRQIQKIADLIARVVFQKSTIAYEIETTANLMQIDMLLVELNCLIAKNDSAKRRTG